MLTVDKTTIDLGTLKYGKTYTFKYMVTNNSPKNMVINKLQTSCSSCTKATMSKLLKENQTTEMKVTYTPGSVGNQLKWVDIIYDSDQHLRVEFKAIVNG